MLILTMVRESLSPARHTPRAILLSANHKQLPSVLTYSRPFLDQPISYVCLYPQTRTTPPHYT